MNTPTFLYLHTIGDNSNINKDARINVNYEPENVGVGKITGLTVTVKTRANWNSLQSTSNELDLENVLLTATSVRFIIDNQIIDLPILARSKYSNAFNNTNSNYYFFEVPPTLFQITPGTTAAITQNIVNVTFLPYVQDEKYEYSDYNPLISNALNNRTSTYIQQSDRIGSSVSPTNINDVLAGTATPAQIQDSNYTSTGWSNARYIGSSTNAQTYKGIPPAITARTFKGEIYPSSSADQLICSRSLLDRIVIDLLFTGDQEIPSFEGPVDTRYELKDNAPSGVTVIPVVANGLSTTIPIEIGSILTVESSTEKLRVVNIKQGVGGASDTITVIRGYLGTTVDNLVQGKNLYALKPLRVFKIDNVNTKIVNSSNSRIWVKDSKEILETDEYGMVYSSSSLCIT